MNYLDILEKQLIVDEGKRNKMYLDSRGIESIGIGHNLRDVPISDRAVRVIFEDDMAAAEADTRKLIKSFDKLTEVRKAVCINLCFNLGYAGFAKFKRTIRFIEAGQHVEAADAILASLYATQVGQRAQRLAIAMREG